jgi:2-amino-4-hydroxy-6-hydroxymethyldihydropteridine diphosphokinase
MRNIAYLSLGSNIGDRAQSLRQAIARLETKNCRVVQVSSFYETEPVEFTDQAWFLNCAVEVETSLTPAELMAALLAIEHSMGRERIQKKGPRIIDLDILLYGDTIIDTPDLTIPHPAMTHRRFVLEPLAEIAPDAVHPIRRKAVGELLSEMPEGQAVKKLSNSI